MAMTVIQQLMLALAPANRRMEYGHPNPRHPVLINLFSVGKYHLIKIFIGVLVT